jgi:hypothetical protein
MKFRQTDTPPVAAAKASFSASTAIASRRIPDSVGAVWNVVGNAVMGVSGGLRLTVQAARSMTA